MTRLVTNYPAGLPDSQVLAIAHAEQRLITNDRDSSKLAFQLRQPHAGVVLVRLGDFAELATKIKYLHGSLHAILAVHPTYLGMLMIKTVFRVPVRDNEGQPFARSFWRELESRLIAAFAAFSRMSGVIGAWESHGRIYRDRSRQYVVSLTSWRQLPGWLALVDWVRDVTRQEAIYIEVAGVPEVLEGQ